MVEPPLDCLGTKCKKSDLLLAALDGIEFGLFVLDEKGRVVFWNKSAERYTGYLSAEMVGSPLSSDLMISYTPQGPAQPGVQASGRGVRYFKHSRGHRVAIRWRSTQLRNAAGELIGRVEWFRAIEDADSVDSHSLSEGSSGHLRKRDALEEHLRNSFAHWTDEGTPLSVLLVRVDQAGGLRRTHGRDACEAMLDVVEKTLAGALRPTEVMGRWGDNEYLMITHHRVLPTLERHAMRLAAIAQMAEFRWWGDKIAITVTVGGTMAVEVESIQSLLARVDDALRHASENEKHICIEAGELPREEEE